MNPPSHAALRLLACLTLTAAATGCTSSTPASIVFASARTGDGDLYVLPPNAQPTPLIATEAPEGGPRFDAARNRIIHQRFDSDTANLIDGTRVLFQIQGADASPVWSQNRIAFSARRNGQEDIYTADLNGSAQSALTNDAEPDRYPAWSPDGSRLAFARRYDDGWDVAVIDLNEKTAGPTRLTHRCVYAGHLSWSPDGKRIAFDTFFEERNAEIAVLNLATGQLTRLTNRTGNDLAPAWSPDGSRMAFAAESDDAGGWDVWELDLATLESRRLTDAPGFDGAPVYVPAEILERVR